MLRPIKLAPLLLALAIMLLAACAGAPTTAVRQVPAEAAEAEALMRAGDFDAAARAFLEAAANDRSERDYYRLRAAEAWREEGMLANAGRALADIRTRPLNEDERQRVLLLQGELALADGQPEQALEWLAIPASRVLPPHRARLFELRGRAAEAIGDAFAAAAEYARLEPLLSGPDRTDNARRIRRLLTGLDDHVLAAGSDALPPGAPLQPYAARALAARGLALPDQFGRDGDRLTRRRDDAAPVRIGLLLPQSGPLRLAATTVRDGFMTAHFAATGERPEVILYDSGERPEQAIAAYRQAVADGVDRVVGPLARESVTALFGEPRLPVPVIALNRSLNPLPPGHLSFALSPDEEAAAVAARMQERGLRRVLAVVGMDDTAQRALGGFTARHLQAGGELIGTVLVPEDSVDFTDVIRRALVNAGVPTSAPRDLKESHDPGFDAVFMALRPSQARLAVPQLRIFGITELPVLATSSINAADDGNRLDRDLNGVEFAEVPWLVGDLPGLPSRSSLANRFDSARGPAARLFAFGMDAYLLLDSTGGRPLDAATIDGATGQLTIDPFGEVRRKPAIATFRNQRARLVDANALLIDEQPAG